MIIGGYSDHIGYRAVRPLNLFKNKTLTVIVTTDDGIRVYVDGNPVIDEWHLQGATTYTKQVEVSAGEHTLKVEWYEWEGSAVSTFKISY